MKCEWAACSCEARVWCGLYWHCAAHYRLHIEFEKEAQRPVREPVRRVAPVPRESGTSPAMRAYKAAWMARKRAQVREQAERDRQLSQQVSA